MHNRVPLLDGFQTLHQFVEPWVRCVNGFEEETNHGQSVGMAYRCFYGFVFAIVVNEMAFGCVSETMDG